jgi:hypothetical protein
VDFKGLPDPSDFESGSPEQRFFLQILLFFGCVYSFQIHLYLFILSRLVLLLLSFSLHDVVSIPFITISLTHSFRIAILRRKVAELSIQLEEDDDASQVRTLCI